MPRERAFRVLDPDYPPSLRELPSPPDPLWVRGELPRGPSVAIVGTRAASPAALAFARGLGRVLAEAGVAVFSGGALGIDSAAHQGALEAGGATVVVTGTGIDHMYPRENARLYEDILANGGALVSPFERDQSAVRWTFLRRNPVLAVLTDALVLVEAPVRSGARSAAMAARRLGRPLFVVPGAPWDPLGAGAFLELSLGATALTSEADIFAALGLSPPTKGEALLPLAMGPARPRPVTPAKSQSRRRSGDPASKSPALPPDLSEATISVWNALGDRALHADDLCVATGLSSAVVHEALLTLTLHAVLVEGPSGCFKRVNA